MDKSNIQRVKQRFGIVGNCEALERAIEIALKIAPVDLSVLVIGENGVGKESFPRIIHEHSLRKNGKFFAVNCGAIPEGTIDSELFGHEKGAFTGAIDQREGYFAAANGGTLFLDEVGELPMQTQARLLRVLETGEYIRVGSSQVRKTNVRIVAATNVNLEEAIAKGRFREDLYYRLNTICIQVPPLRERGEDADLLFRKFALDMAERYKMPAIRLNAQARQMLINYSWPGNVRQLRNLAENMSITAEEREITPEILERYLPRKSMQTQMVAVGQGQSSEHAYDTERDIIFQILVELRRDVDELKNLLRKHGTTAKLPQIPQSESKSLPYSASVAYSECTGGEVPYSDIEEVKDEDSPIPSLGSADVLPDKRCSLDEMERERIEQSLKANNGRRKETADELGISERTLYRKIKKYGLDTPDHL